MNTEPKKRNAVYVNLYIDYVFPETTTREEAHDALKHMLQTFAVQNPQLVVKLIKSPECPPDSDTIYLP